MIEMILWALLANGVQTERLATLADCLAFQAIWIESELKSEPIIVRNNAGDISHVVDWRCYQRERPKAVGPTS